MESCERSSQPWPKSKPLLRVLICWSE
ncbi:uncharacterized, partial [Tachysurus ichikawai]